MFCLYVRRAALAGPMWHVSACATQAGRLCQTSSGKMQHVANAFAKKTRYIVSHPTESRCRATEPRDGFVSQLHSYLHVCTWLPVLLPSEVGPQRKGSLTAFEQSFKTGYVSRLLRINIAANGRQDPSTQGMIKAKIEAQEALYAQSLAAVRTA